MNTLRIFLTSLMDVVYVQFSLNLRKTCFFQYRGQVRWYKKVDFKNEAISLDLSPLLNLIYLKIPLISVIFFIRVFYYKMNKIIGDSLFNENINRLF